MSYVIRCDDCDNVLARGQTIKNTLAEFLDEAYLHNKGDQTKLCEDTVKELSLSNMASALRGDTELNIYKEEKTTRLVELDE